MRVLDTLLAASSSGDESVASPVVVEYSGVAADAVELHKVVSSSDELRVDVYADSTNALAVSEPVSLKGDSRQATGYLVFTLVQQNGDWLASDIDFETLETGRDEIERFLQRHPDAKLLTQ